MDDATIKNKISRALSEPHAPQRLVERTIVRVRAIEAGREAEAALAALGSAAPTEHTRALAARGAVGRLMASNAPPEGAGIEQLERQLAALPAFRALTDRPADQVLQDLQSGKLTAQLLRAVPAAKPAARQSAKPQPLRKDPTPRLP